MLDTMTIWPMYAIGLLQGLLSSMLVFLSVQLFGVPCHHARSEAALVTRLTINPGVQVCFNRGQNAHVLQEGVVTEAWCHAGSDDQAVCAASSALLPTPDTDRPHARGSCQAVQ